MLLKSIAEVAGEPLTVDTADPMAEDRTSTWRLSADPRERVTLTTGQVCAAFERTADAVRSRIRGLGFQGTVTFYVWHDEQAGQLQCSTSSRTPGTLPFRGAYIATDALGPIIERFLADEEPGQIPWSDLDTAAGEPEEDAVITPFPVWTRNVGRVSAGG